MFRFAAKIYAGSFLHELLDWPKITLKTGLRITQQRGQKCLERILLAYLRPIEAGILLHRSLSASQQLNPTDYLTAQRVPSPLQNPAETVI